MVMIGVVAAQLGTAGRAEQTDFSVAEPGRKAVEQAYIAAALFGQLLRRPTPL